MFQLLRYYQILCATLDLDAEKDDSFPAQPRKLFEALSCPKKYILLILKRVQKNIVNAVQLHCQPKYI